jgi:hypothetical protein
MTNYFKGSSTGKQSLGNTALCIATAVKRHLSWGITTHFLSEQNVNQISENKLPYYIFITKSEHLRLFNLYRCVQRKFKTSCLNRFQSNTTYGQPALNFVVLLWFREGTLIYKPTQRFTTADLLLTLPLIFMKPHIYDISGPEYMCKFRSL